MFLMNRQSYNNNQIGYLKILEECQGQKDYLIYPLLA